MKSDDAAQRRLVAGMESLSGAVDSERRHARPSLRPAVVYPAFVIAKWGGPDNNVSLKINGRTKTRGIDYRLGIEVDGSGTYTLVIWLPLSATEPVSFEFGDGK
ncbi:MAG: hypothetical protein MUF81_21425 [Verrucomicrobia bacterium]|nr:hypothetical protein [Verrucomicrobiota bacterium]